MHVGVKFGLRGDFIGRKKLNGVFCMELSREERGALLTARQLCVILSLSHAFIVI
jgi:hypothetical protein